MSDKEISKKMKGIEEYLDETREWDFEHYKNNTMEAQQELFDHFYEQHGMTLTHGEINDIIELVKKEIGFAEKIKNAYAEGVRSEHDHHVYCSHRIYKDAEDYFIKKFKQQ